jgi:lipopolysaccharide transport system permease protein
MPDAIETLPETWTIEPRSTGLGSRVREMWRYRRMFWFFGKRALQKLYRNTVLGAIWIPLRPLIPLLVRLAVFGGLLGVGTGPGGTPYFIFLAVGSAAWELFASAVMWATRSLDINGGMLTRIYVPRLILPIATMVPGVVYFLIHVAVIVCALVYYRFDHGVWYVDATWMIVAPASIILILLFALAIGLWTSVLAVAARDVRFGLGYALDFWVFLTPVMYPMAMVPADVRWMFLLNPMTVLVIAFRGAILGGEGPDPWAWATAIGIIAVVLVAGLAYFQRAETEAVDNL